MEEAAAEEEEGEEEEEEAATMMTRTRTMMRTGEKPTNFRVPLPRRPRRPHPDPTTMTNFSE